MSTKSSEKTCNLKWLQQSVKMVLMHDLYRSVVLVFVDWAGQVLTYPAQWVGQVGTSWQPGQPGTQTLHRPSARHAGCANDVPLRRGRQSLCNVDSLQYKYICLFYITLNVRLSNTCPPTKKKKKEGNFYPL